MNAASIKASFEAAPPFVAHAADAPIKITASPFRWPEARTLPRRPWVFGRWLLRETVSAIVAPGGVGKSSFVASMILSLASGRDILGKQVWGGAKSVHYWNLEDSMGELEKQLTAAAMFHDVHQPECGDRVYLDSGPEGDGLCIAIEDNGGFKIVTPVVEALVAELLARRIDVLIIDPFVSSHGVSENDNGAIDAVAKTWARIAKRANCAVVLVHHTKKLGGEKATAESSRGATALIAAARVTLVLNRMDRDEAKRFGVGDDAERRRLFTVQDDKSNRAPAEDARWFRLASQDIGNAAGPNDPYGEYGDSVGVVTRWTPPDAFENVTVEHLRAVQTLVAGGAYKENHQAADWVGKAVAEVLGISADRDAAADRAKINALLRTWFGTGALVVVERRDPEKREMKKYVEVGVPAEDGAPPPSSGAGHSGAGRAPTAPRPTCPPLGAGGGAGGAAAAKEVGRGSATTAAQTFVEGNPALGPVVRDLSRVMFAANADDDGMSPHEWGGIEG